MPLTKSIRSGSLYYARIKANHFCVSNPAPNIDRSSSSCVLDHSSGNAREQSETWGTPSTRERNWSETAWRPRTRDQVSVFSITSLVAKIADVEERYGAAFRRNLESYRYLTNKKGGGGSDRFCRLQSQLRLREDGMTIFFFGGRDFENRIS